MVTTLTVISRLLDNWHAASSTTNRWNIDIGLLWYHRYCITAAGIVVAVKTTGTD